MHECVTHPAVQLLCALVERDCTEVSICFEVKGIGTFGNFWDGNTRDGDSLLSFLEEKAEFGCIDEGKLCFFGLVFCG